MKCALNRCSAPCSTAFRRRFSWTAWRFSWRIPRTRRSSSSRARWACGPKGTLDLSFLDPGRPALDRGCLFFESARAAIGKRLGAPHLEELDLNYFIACRFRDRTVAVLGLGKTVDGDYLSSDDLELLSTIAGYVAIAIENARLYQSLEQKALQIERLKDFSENIVESLNIGVLTVDLEDRIESWNPQLEELARNSAARCDWQASLRKCCRGIWSAKLRRARRASTFPESTSSI